MPATHLERKRQDNYARAAMSASGQSDQGSASQCDDLERDFKLIVNFPGCPSSSTRITMPKSECLYDQSQTVESCEAGQEAEALFNKDSTFFRNRVECKAMWHQHQGQNNNWCSESPDDNIGSCGNDHGTENEGSLLDTGESQNNGEAFMEADGNQDASRSISDASDDSLEDNKIAASSINFPTSDAVENHKDCSGPPKGEHATKIPKRKHGEKFTNLSRNPFRDYQASKQQESPSEDQKQRNGKSATTLIGCGRALFSRKHRSPQRNNSPSRRKKGNFIHGSSAPAPFVFTPAQSSTGFINIGRSSSASPTNSDDVKLTAKNSTYRSPNKGAFSGNSVTIQPREVLKRDENASGGRQSIIGQPPPSPSFGSSNLHRQIKTISPTQSLAESDLRDHIAQANSALPTIEPKKMPCHLILPEDPWSTRTPHGDFQQISPQKMMEMSRLALNASQQLQQSQESQLLKKASCPVTKDSNSTLPDITKSIFGSVDISPLTAAAANTFTATASVAKMKNTSDNDESKSASLSSSCSRSVTRSRSSRRHPVLDKMFRHVLASLVMESGPPSSACLASVLEQVKSQSTTDTIASRFPNNRLGKTAIYGSGGICNAESGSADVTVSASSPLPCTLSKINEEIK